MNDLPNLHNPCLVAVWPGMGHVAISGGYYLMSKLNMHWFAELSALELFDIDFIEVKDGVIQASRMPRNRFFVWKDPQERRDIVVFIGEAQPPLGKAMFCHRLIEFARQIGVRRVYTFAAMATQMNPDVAARVFCAATTASLLKDIGGHGPVTLDEGRISGLNGILLAAAREAGLEGACLLGEMPHIFAQMPFPKASLAILKAFSRIANISLDFSELEEQAEAVSKKLGELLAQVEENLARQVRGEEPEEEFGQQTEEERLGAVDKQRIESLFAESQRDRSKAYELKGELDRLGVFAEYEDRFLDLFKKPKGNGD